MTQTGQGCDSFREPESVQEELIKGSSHQIAAAAVFQSSMFTEIYISVTSFRLSNNFLCRKIEIKPER